MFVSGGHICLLIALLCYWFWILFVYEILTKSLNTASKSVIKSAWKDHIKTQESFVRHIECAETVERNSSKERSLRSVDTLDEPQETLITYFLT